jgi:hypothetical protein
LGLGWMDAEGDNVSGSASKLHRRVMEDVLKEVRADWLAEGVDPLLPDRLRVRWTEKMGARDVVKSEGAVNDAARALLREDAPAPPLPPDAPLPVAAVKREAEAAVVAPPPAEKKAKVVKEEGEESLSSLSDDSDVIVEDDGGGALLLCQFETVKKTKNTWKVKLRYGLLSTETQDYRFAVANTVLTRW